MGVQVQGWVYTLEIRRKRGAGTRLEHVGVCAQQHCVARWWHGMGTNGEVVHAKTRGNKVRACGRAHQASLRPVNDM